MPKFSTLASTVSAGLLAASLSLPSAALAQDYGPGPAGYDAPPETVTVTAPHFKEDPQSQLRPLEKVSLSSAVSFSDLDLSTRAGAAALRHRVRETAHEVCRQLAEAYPFYTAPGTHCYREAVESGLRHANAAIQTARGSRWE